MRNTEGMSKTMEEATKATVAADLERLEQAAFDDARKLGMSETACSAIARGVRNGYLAGWARGHDCASAVALDIMREAGQGRWPSAPAAAGAREVPDAEPARAGKR